MAPPDMKVSDADVAQFLRYLLGHPDAVEVELRQEQQRREIFKPAIGKASDDQRQ